MSTDIRSLILAEIEIGITPSASASWLSEIISRSRHACRAAQASIGDKIKIVLNTFLFSHLISKKYKCSFALSSLDFVSAACGRLLGTFAACTSLSPPLLLGHMLRSESDLTLALANLVPCEHNDKKKRTERRGKRKPNWLQTRNLPQTCRVKRWEARKT